MTPRPHKIEVNQIGNPSRTSQVQNVFDETIEGGSAQIAGLRHAQAKQDLQTANQFDKQARIQADRNRRNTNIASRICHKTEA
jgi:hypothetical protein